MIGTPQNGKGDVGRQGGDPRRVRHSPFAWDSQCQYVCNTLNNAPCNAPVLALPDPQAKYCLHLHPSQYAFGAVLSHVQDKPEKVLGYLSSKLNNAETRYPADDREPLGIRDAIVYCRSNLH
jgi:hypothetical protein